MIINVYIWMIYLSVHILIYDYDSTDQRDAKWRIQDSMLEGGGGVYEREHLRCKHW